MTRCAAATRRPLPRRTNAALLWGRGRESSSATAKSLFRYFPLPSTHTPHCSFLALPMWDNSLCRCRSFLGKNSRLHTQKVKRLFTNSDGDGSGVAHQGKGRARQAPMPKAMLEFVTRSHRFVPESAAFSRLKQQQNQSSPSEQDP